MTTRLTPWRASLLGLLFALAPGVAISQNATFTPIGPATTRSIVPRDISSNGKIVIGDIQLEDGLTHPFMWNRGVFTLLADPSSEGMASGISSDGSAVAVTLNIPFAGYRPFRWTAAGGLQMLALPLSPDQDQSLFTGRISKDGSTIIGQGSIGLRLGAFKWTPTGIEEIVGAFPARGISDDGAVIVGDRIIGGGTVVNPFAPFVEAFRWTATGGLVGLGSLWSDSAGWLVSGDGKVVIGSYGPVQAYGTVNQLLFRWTELSGSEDIPARGSYNVPTAISFDGNIVLSTAGTYENSPSDAAIWTAATNSNELLKTYLLADIGIPSRQLNGWRLNEARALTPDGRCIVGYGDNPDGLKQMFMIEFWPESPPVITSPPSASATYGSPFSYSITATNYPDSFYIPFLPAGLSLNENTGVVSGSPNGSGTFGLDLTASNDAGDGLGFLVLQINKAAASITVSNTTQSYTGTPRPVSITTTPADLTTVVTYNGSSAAPTAPGAYQINAVISEPNYEGSATATLTVIPPAPVITSSSSANATYGSQFTYTITASNNPTSFDAAPLPSGLSIDKTSGVISGQPSSIGVFSINLKASNAGGDGGAVLNLQVSKGIAGVVLSNTSQVYTGTPRSISTTTTPTGLAVVVTYDGASTAPSAVGTYQVNATISDANYAGSATGTLTIYTSTLQILTQPANLTVNEGSPASFTVKASGPGSLTYQWRKGTAANAPVIGTSSTLSIARATLADAGTYKVTVSNGTSTVTSVSAKLVVNSVPVVIAPAITQQPLSQTVTLNPKKSVSVSFSVTATGTGPLNYQWRRNGVAVTGATSSAFTISKVVLGDNGAQFQVMVSNSAGSVLSNTATLTVK